MNSQDRVDQITDDELLDLLEQADYAPLHAQVEILERALRRTDSTDNVVGGYEVRMRLLPIYHEVRELDKLMVAFAWCVARADDYGFDPYELLGIYYWVTNWLTSTPDITLPQILAIHDDLEKRSEQLGWGERMAYVARYKTLFRLGLQEEAVRYAGKFKATGVSDKPDCEVGHEIEMLVKFARDEEALALSDRFLNLESECENCNRNIHSVALIALLRLGRHQDAARAHQVGYGLLGSSATYLFNVPGHLLHLTREGDLGRAASILERFLPTALQCDDLDDRFSFYAAAAPLLQRVAAEQEEIQLRLPPEFPPFEASGRYRAHALSEWFDGQADALADRFDTRNGNDNYRWHQTEFRRLSSLAS